MNRLKEKKASDVAVGNRRKREKAKERTTKCGLFNLKEAGE